MRPGDDERRVRELTLSGPAGMWQFLWHPKDHAMRTQELDMRETLRRDRRRLKDTQSGIIETTKRLEHVQSMLQARIDTDHDTRRQHGVAVNTYGVDTAQQEIDMLAGEVIATRAVLKSEQARVSHLQNKITTAIKNVANMQNFSEQKRDMVDEATPAQLDARRVALAAAMSHHLITMTGNVDHRTTHDEETTGLIDDVAAETQPVLVKSSQHSEVADLIASMRLGTNAPVERLSHQPTRAHYDSVLRR